MNRRLAVVFGGDFETDPAGRVLMPDKLVDGLVAYTQRWSGPVTLVAGSAPHDESGNLGSYFRDPQDLPFELALSGDRAESLRRLRPAMTLLPVNIAHRYAAAVPSYVAVAENPPHEEYRLIVALGMPLAQRPRAFLGGIRRLGSYARVVRGAVGVQCNGYPAMRLFGRHSPRPLLYFDTRLTRTAVAREAGRPRPPLAAPLRLGFSGRLAGEKGPQFAVEAHRRLARAGAPTTLTIFGSGPMEEQLRREAADGVIFAGSVPFESEWIERIPREVDLMVLPHPQGDPSGTYLEAAGLGVPFVAFANVAAQSLTSRHGLGWSTRMNDVGGLVRRIQRLNEDPSQVRAAADRGRAFMTEHCFEHEFDRRVEHLEACAAISAR